MINNIENTNLNGLHYVNEGMAKDRQETVLSAIAQSITGNLTVRVKVCPIDTGVGYTDKNIIFAADDDTILKVFQRHDRKPVNPFLVRLKIVVHETLHALFTPHKELEAQKVSLSLEGYPPNKVSHIFNVIEDLIIESREASVFGGWVHSAFLYGSYVNFMCSPRIEQNAPADQWEAAVINLRDSINLNMGLRLKGRFSSWKAGELYSKTKPMLERIVNLSHSGADKFNLMKDIARMILDTFPESKKLSDEEMLRKPLDSRVAQLPDMPRNVMLPDIDGTEKNRSSIDRENADKREATDGETANDRDESRTSSDETNPHDHNEENISKDSVKSEDITDKKSDSDLTESDDKMDNERKISKILKQINQYALGLEKMENNSSMSDTLIAKDFGEVFKHVEKHTGSLTVLPEDRTFYNDSIRGNLRLIRSLHALFKKELKRIKDENEYYSSGRIDPLRYHTHSKRSVEFFKRPLGDSGLNEAAITVRIDQSGSMSNRYSKRGKKLCYEAGELACVLTEVFIGLSVSLQVAGFAEVGNEEEHEIFKEFSSSTTPKEAVAKSRLNKSSATPTGWTIYQGITELMRRPEKNKVFILITDGYPSSQVSKYFMSTNHIRKYIREAESNGIAFLCLLVGECEPSLHHKIFGDSLIVANRNSSLAVAISPKLKKTAKKWNN